MSIVKNILFRANASSSIGTGHIMRDLVLAKQYPNSNIFFATQNLAGNLNHKIIESGYELVDLKSNDLNELIQVVKTYKIDKVIIDNYAIDYKFEKALKKSRSVELMVLDDTYERHYCDVLLNHNISADESRYKDLVPKWCELRCGSKYTLLRDEFLKEKELKREKLYDFFVAMGGADTANLNIEILKLLPKEKKVALVTTNANKNLKNLKEYVKNKTNIILFINSNEIAKLINQSRLAIITPSVTVNEVYFLRVSFIAIKTAGNQEDIFNFLRQKGYITLDYKEIDLLKYKVKEVV